MFEKSNTMNRRAFISILPVIFFILQLPLSACKRLLSGNKDDEIPEAAKKTLKAVLMHLFPAGEGIPSADELNSQEHIIKIYHDKTLLKRNKKLIKNGIRWVDDTSIKLFDKNFILLVSSEKERVLRKMEQYRKGRRWLSLILTYLLEALLGDPVYQINTDEKGWKWLDHIPGSPRPTKKNMYEAG